MVRLLRSFVQVFQGTVGLSWQKELIMHKLRGKEFKVEDKDAFLCEIPTDKADPNQGTVFLDARGNNVKVYLQSRVIRDTPKAS
jgi:hypothetical protein